jgi:phage terminase small subunit
MSPQKEKKLTPKERLFVAEYLKDFNATQAAIRAGYSKKTARSIGYENLTKPHIQKALSQARNSIEKREEAALLGAHEVERRADLLIVQNPKAYYNEDGTMKSIHELTPEQAYAINEISTIQTELGTHQKLKFESKRGAIELKMKRLGMLQPTKVENNTNNTLFLMTYEERLMRALKRCGIERDPKYITNTAPKGERERQQS